MAARPPTSQDGSGSGSGSSSASSASQIPVPAASAGASTGTATGRGSAFRPPASSTLPHHGRRPSASSAASHPAPARTAAAPTAAQALARQPAPTAPAATPSLFAPIAPAATATTATASPTTTTTTTPTWFSAPAASTSNPSTRILSTANLSTPVPTSASSSATFLTASSSSSASSHFAPLGTPSTSGTHTPTPSAAYRSTSSSSANAIAALPLSLSFGISANGTGSPRMPSSQHHTGVYTAPTLVSTAAFFSTAGAASLAAGGGASGSAWGGAFGHQGTRGSPTPRGIATTTSTMLTTASLGASITPAMVGGVPSTSTTSSAAPSGTVPAWYRHPTSGLLPLLEVPTAYLSSGSASTSSANAPSHAHARTASMSAGGALLRSSVGLTSRRAAGSSGQQGAAGRASYSGASAAAAAAALTHRNSAPNPLHAGPIAGGTMSEDTVVSFSWVIGELALLRDEVEGCPSHDDEEGDDGEAGGRGGAGAGRAGGGGWGGGGGGEGRSISAGAGRNAVWTTQPCFGDPKLPKWKLELVRTQRVVRPSGGEGEDGDGDGDEEEVGEGGEREVTADQWDGARAGSPSGRSEGAGEHASGKARAKATTVLSVYLTSLALEYLPSDALIPATIMLGLQPARTTLARLQSRTGAWLWQEYASHVFRREAEFFECHSLPTLSELLERYEEVRAQDAVKLTVQIGCGPGIVGPGTEVGGVGVGAGVGAGSFGAGRGGRGSGSAPGPRNGQEGAGHDAGLMLAPFPRLAPFQVPSAHYVSQTILDALEGLVDCARTGDVRIIVRERGLLVHPSVGPGAAGAMSDDGHGGGGYASEAQAQHHPPAPYVLPYPVGSFFPLDDTDTADPSHAAQFELELSDVLPPGGLGPHGGDRPSAGSASASASVVVRDRIIWAHSSVLRARSQYFADMLDGSFAEAQDVLDDDDDDGGGGEEADGGDGGGLPSSYHLHAHGHHPHGTGTSHPRRAIKTFRIPDSEWATVYWLIRYLYLEEIEFAAREDVRSTALDTEWMISAEGLVPAADVVDSGGAAGLRRGRSYDALGEQGEGLSSQVLIGRSGARPNWEWRTIQELVQEEEDAMVAAAAAAAAAAARRGGASEAQLEAGGGTVGGYHPREDVETGPSTSVEYAPAYTTATTATAGVSSSTTTGAAAAASSLSSKVPVQSSPTSSWRGHPGTIYSSSHPPPKSHVEPTNMTSSSSSLAGLGEGGSTTTDPAMGAHGHGHGHVGGGGGAGAVASGSLHPRREGSSSTGTGTGTSFTTHDDVHPSSHGAQPPPPSTARTHPRSTGRTDPAPALSSALDDPHPHPAPRAPPASALATYKLAHRYGQAGLAELAKAHILETLTPASAFPVLLATALYGGLHEGIKRYVYEHWDEVSHTDEFERCCDEVGAGEWGAEAGRSLRIFMQSLLSPARIVLAHGGQR